MTIDVSFIARNITPSETYREHVRERAEQRDRERVLVRRRVRRDGRRLARARHVLHEPGVVLPAPAGPAAGEGAVPRVVARVVAARLELDAAGRAPLVVPAGTPRVPAASPLIAQAAPVDGRVEGEGGCDEAQQTERECLSRTRSGTWVS